MSDSLNAAVIGCGYWGPNLVRNINSLPNIRMKTVCDLSSERLNHMKILYPGISITMDFDEIVNDRDIDAVAIATPVFTHYKLAKACLQAGKHVLVEKPLAASRAQCLELIKLSKEMGKVLMVGHTFEYTAAVNKAKSLLKSGELGDILYISCMRLNLGLFQPDINVVWDLAPHDISILLYLLEDEPVAVNGQGKAHYYENIEDVATSTLHFENGEIAFLHQSWLDPYKVRRITIVGTKKMLVYDDVQPNEKIKIFDKGVDVPPHYNSFGEFHFAYRYGDIFSPRIEDSEPLKVECQHFVECILENKTPRSDGYSGLRVVTILEAICESMRNYGTAVWLRQSDRTEVVGRNKFATEKRLMLKKIDSKT